MLQLKSFKFLSSNGNFLTVLAEMKVRMLFILNQLNSLEPSELGNSICSHGFSSTLVMVCNILFFLYTWFLFIRADETRNLN